jgi:hypothetical protein
MDILENSAVPFAPSQPAHLLALSSSSSSSSNLGVVMKRRGGTDALDNGFITLIDSDNNNNNNNGRNSTNLCSNLSPAPPPTSMPHYLHSYDDINDGLGTPLLPSKEDAFI